MDVKELSKVMGAAYALVYPSMFEGFGIPILEAMRCGVPAVVSNTSSMPEVAGDAAITIDPNDVEDLASGMEKIYKNEALHADLSKKALLQSQKFDWAASAKLLYGSLVKCLPLSPSQEGEKPAVQG